MDSYPTADSPRPASGEARPKRSSNMSSATPLVDVPFFDAAAVNDGFDAHRCVDRVVGRHHYVLGREVSAFERTFADYVGSDHCTAVGNGTDALTLALRSVGVRAGDHVLQVANAGFYSSTATYAVGGTPLYVDIDPESCLVDLAALEAALAKTQGVGAIVATHLYGNMVDMVSVMSLARQFDVPVVEDCAQAHGARMDARAAGTFGDVGCFSFYPTKNLGALGDAGAVVTSNLELYQGHQSLRQYGWGRKYEVHRQGGANSRMDELQAAFLCDKLPLLAEHNRWRTSVAARYTRAFRGLPLHLPVNLGERSVHHLYVLQTDRRDALQQFLAKRGIASAIHYPVPDHRQAAYSGPETPKLPATEASCAMVLSLPCYPGMPKAHVDAAVSSVIDFYAPGGPVAAC